MKQLKLIQDWEKPSGVVMPEGLVIEVADGEADRLLADFPGIFAEVPADEQAEASSDQTEDPSARRKPGAAPENKAAQPDEDKSS